MHSNPTNFPGKPMFPVGNQVGYYMQNARMASLFDGLVAPRILPLCNVDIQTSDACPRNFIIFDQTSSRSQIMLHPEISSKMFYPGETPILQGKLIEKEATDEREVASQLKEDSDDIDALLSTEYEDLDEGSDDEVSTARTNAIYECSSPDSCSNYEPVSKKSRSFFKKRQRMSKMVKALRGIIPGAKRMSSVAVLDEAVRYLKSLRVEVKKLGVGNWKE